MKKTNQVILWTIHLFTGLGMVFLNQGPIYNVFYFLAWTITLIYLLTYLIMMIASTNKEVFKRHVIDVGPLQKPALHTFSMVLHVCITILFAAAGKYILAACLIAALMFFTVYRTAYIKCREDMQIKVFSEV